MSQQGIDPRYPVGKFVAPAAITADDRNGAIATLAELPEELVWLQVSEYPDRAMVQLYAGLALDPGDIRIVPPSA